MRIATINSKFSPSIVHAELYILFAAFLHAGFLDAAFSTKPALAKSELSNVTFTDDTYFDVHYDLFLTVNA